MLTIRPAAGNLGSLKIIALWQKDKYKHKKAYIHIINVSNKKNRNSNDTLTNNNKQLQF